VRSNLTLNLGLRYELDTDVKNIERYDEINPIVQPFLQGDRGMDLNNFGPRIGFNWSTPSGKSSLHGGYGIYFDRITLEIQTLERGLDGRALPIEVRAGSAIFLDIFGPPLPPFAPSISNPFTGFILPGAGASGINIIDNTMQNPQTQQFNLGIEHQVGDKWRVRLDGIHALGTHFIIGRDVGVVFNPVVGGPDRVVNLESSVRTHYDALLASVERRLSQGVGVRASYAFSKALNYANDDQIPFSNGPIDSNNLYREYGPTPNDQRHRFTLAASWDAPVGFQLSTIWTLASGETDIRSTTSCSTRRMSSRSAGWRTRPAREYSRMPSISASMRCMRDRISSSISRISGRRSPDAARSSSIHCARLAMPRNGARRSCDAAYANASSWVLDRSSASASRPRSSARVRSASSTRFR